MTSLFRSRKFFLLSISLFGMVLYSATGIEISPEQVETMANLVMAWLVGQGIADAGAGGSTRPE